MLRFEADGILIDLGSSVDLFFLRLQLETLRIIGLLQKMVFERSQLEKWCNDGVLLADGLYESLSLQATFTTDRRC